MFNFNTKGVSVDNRQKVKFKKINNLIFEIVLIIKIQGIDYQKKINNFFFDKTIPFAGLNISF